MWWPGYLDRYYSFPVLISVLMFLVSIVVIIDASFILFLVLFVISPVANFQLLS